MTAGVCDYVLWIFGTLPNPSAEDEHTLSNRSLKRRSALSSAFSSTIAAALDVLGYMTCVMERERQRDTRDGCRLKWLETY